ncbi:MAG: hypothetical protein ABFD98_06530 [Syntrophobacteraceae bacterium]
MRDLKDYSAREWLRNKPLDHFLIDLCNDTLQGFFLKCRPKALDRFLQNVKHMKGRDIGLVVAFQQPGVVDWLLQAASRHIANGTLLVFDNSREERSRVEIARVCQEHGTPCLPLPPNPTRHPNRSHGMAMSWIFHNVVRRIQPRTFTYIDHDLIPVKKVELGQALGGQPFYGRVKKGRWGWALWAGYCCFDFATVRDLPLNFLNDFSRGLDTGGRNWSCLYKNYDPNLLRFVTTGAVTVVDPADGTERALPSLDGAWVHLRGAGYRSGFEEILKRCRRSIEAGEAGMPPR